MLVNVDFTWVSHISATQRLKTHATTKLLKQKYFATLLGYYL